MNPLRRRIIAALAAAPCLAPLGAAAQTRRAFEELNPPQPVEAAGKVEVLEFFWYGCIHCYNLEPKLETWLKKLPSDVEFRRVPAVFNQRWAHDATIFYAFEAMGVLDKLHRPFFDAIHRERLRSDNWQELSAWLGKQGVDAKKFEATAKSFGVQAKMKRAVRLTTDYKIDGTPAMAVHGRYTVPSNDGMLDTVNELVSAVRKNK
ncbi:MAG: DSBA-like thioredoxin domain protein [Burkholderiales bacterium]|nr:DSBA-like thioredoxin domain protein [Burkholderiales bacterium]